MLILQFYAHSLLLEKLKISFEISILYHIEPLYTYRETKKFVLVDLNIIK